jgi:hypothetical protein
MTIRSVEIASLSASQELIAVVRTAMAIAVATWLYLAISPFAFSNDGSPRRNLWPYQSLIQDRPADEQRMFRELQVSLLEAETMRATTGEWPPVAALAAEGIEPFAPNPALKGSSYTWRLIREGRFISYVGIPATPPASTPQRPTSVGDAPAWLVLVQEPDPAAPEPFIDDEEHDRLVDGSVLHVSIWNRPEGASFPTTVLRSPHLEGWIQLYAAPPPTSHAVIAAPVIAAPPAP